MMSDLREKISDNISTWHYDLLLGKHVKESSFDLASGIIAMVLDEAIEPELKVIKQALLEVRHAQNSGAGWYTRGSSGLFMQVRMWLDKADKAFKAIEKLKTTSD